ncbi:MAG: DUF4091 domain-containing protein [Clostridia bacterium]|nr:DUF4091 domain-containing protein [Clostridia bacterium]
MIKGRIKIVSSLEKPLAHESFDGFTPLTRISALRGERLSFQVIHTVKSDNPVFRGRSAFIDIEGELAQYATLRDVCSVPIDRPTVQHSTAEDTNYITKGVGIFPDVLRPLHNRNSICLGCDSLMSVWVEIELPEDIADGIYDTAVILTDESGGFLAREYVAVEIIDAILPPQSIYYTDWLHCDCLASYYNVPMWSERHWEIIESFMKNAKRNGVNMMLTPILTPPLDTAVGGERPTAQLVEIVKTDGEYIFDFSRLDRWIELCNRVGIKYFEINHLATQWGSAHAPKVMATEGGEYKQIFGWETDSTGEEYLSFLGKLLSALISHMKSRGDDSRLFFHISDEPFSENLETYRKIKSAISGVLSGYPVMDAISHIEFYLDGTCDMPIPATNRISPFLKENIPGLWTYYCCSQAKHVSNRFITMPACRNRSIGYQMYKYGIKGFLHWGYNFYYNLLSYDLINPYMQLDGNAWVPPGDAFSVYPNMDGTPLESTRIKVFYDALQDMRAMALLEELCGKDAVVKIIDGVLGCDSTFDDCAKEASEILTIREKVNKMIKKHLRDLKRT